MNGAGFEIERGRRVDRLRQRIKPGGAEFRGRQRNVFQRFHQVAEHGALRAARGLHFLLQFLLVIGRALGPHHDDAQLLVVIDAGDHVVRPQHALIEQIADREIFRMIRDRHGGDDLLRIEEDRERALDRHHGVDLVAGLVDAGNALGQPRIVRIGLDQIIVARTGHVVSPEQIESGRQRQSAGQLLHFFLHHGFGFLLGVGMRGDQQILEDFLFARASSANGRSARPSCRLCR